MEDPFPVSYLLRLKIDMRQDVFILLILFVAMVGITICGHLVFFQSKNIKAKMLGWYTLLLTISSVEPLKQFIGDHIKLFFEVLVGTGAFMIGPTLFLYCNYRLLNKPYWIKADALHFIPALVIFLLMFSAPAAQPGEESVADVIFYFIFISHLFTYTLKSFLLVLREKKRHRPQALREQFHLPFLACLVTSSFVLFAYSFLSTLFGLNEASHFKLCVQGLLTLIIIVIVLLNAETLENHPSEDTQSRNAIWK